MAALHHHAPTKGTARPSPSPPSNVPPMTAALIDSIFGVCRRRRLLCHELAPDDRGAVGGEGRRLESRHATRDVAPKGPNRTSRLILVGGRYKHVKALRKLPIRKLLLCERKMGESYIALVQAPETWAETAVGSIDPLLRDVGQDRRRVPPPVLASGQEAAAGNTDVSRKIAEMMRPWRKSSFPTKLSVSCFTVVQPGLLEHEQRAHVVADISNDCLFKLMAEGAPKLDVVLTFTTVAEHACAMPDDEHVLTHLVARLMSQASTACKALKSCGHGSLTEDFDLDDFEIAKQLELVCQLIAEETPFTIMAMWPHGQSRQSSWSPSARHHSRTPRTSPMWRPKWRAIICIALRRRRTRLVAICCPSSGGICWSTLRTPPTPWRSRLWPSPTRWRSCRAPRRMQLDRGASPIVRGFDHPRPLDQEVYEQHRRRRGGGRRDQGGPGLAIGQACLHNNLVVVVDAAKSSVTPHADALSSLALEAWRLACAH